jgi:hypothetical protein
MWNRCCSVVRRQARAGRGQVETSRLSGLEIDLTAVLRGTLTTLSILAATLVGTSLPLQADDGTPVGVAARLDALIDQKIREAGAEPAPQCRDEDFLRRLSIDLTGGTPRAADVTLFGLDSTADKRAKVISRLLDSPEFAANWSRYWRDVIFMNATEPRSRLMARTFEGWMTAQLAENRGWDGIVTDLLTATGPVLENGATALFFAHAAEPEEIASEVSRIFLGIQVQCANCHDHPTDQWKREQFHTLAAFFPRVQLKIDRSETGPLTFSIVSFQPRPTLRNGRSAPSFDQIRENPEPLIAMLDRDGDKLVSAEEARRGPGNGQLFGRALQIGDLDKDGKLSADEFKKLPPPMENPGRGAAEHLMPDLQNPKSPGTTMEPKFFLTGETFASGQNDLERRRAAARMITARDNPWFAKAVVNRVWFELLGETFVTPVDDLGPEREASYPEVFDLLAAEFTRSGYNLKWLFETIVSTRAYQRKVQSRSPDKPLPLFAAAVPSRMRADELFGSLVRVLGIEEDGSRQISRQPGAGRFGDASPRGQFHNLFAFNPSATPDEMIGTIPQALFLMNSPELANRLKGTGSAPLADLLKRFSDDGDLISELYLLVHARQPSDAEMSICRDYLATATNRVEGCEDLFWSLVNSAEFLSKR